MSKPCGAFSKLVARYARPGMIVVEVGVWDGSTSKEWVPVVQENAGEAVLIDLWLGNPTAKGIHAKREKRADEVFDILKDRLKDYSCVRYVEMDSTEAASLFSDGSVDICFLDADHRFSKVSQDIMAWMPKVKAGGILCGHDCEELGNWIEKDTETDYTGKHHGVIKAVSTLVPGAKLIEDSVWTYCLPQK